MFLKAVKGRRLKLRSPNTSTELSFNLVGSLSINFLDCRADLYEEFLCQYKFQLSLSFSRQNKEVETKSKIFMCFDLIFNINTQIVQYLIVLTFEVRMIYVDLGFFMNFTYTFYTCEGKKNEKLKYTQINYQTYQTNDCSKAMRQRKYFRSKNKNYLDIDSYMKCLTQRNCKRLKVM